MKHQVLLTKLESTHSNLRTPTVEGVCFALPNEGESFVMFAPSLDPEKDQRIIVTSEVVEIEKRANWIRFKTRNSFYELKWEEAA